MIYIFIELYSFSSELSLNVDCHRLGINDAKLYPFCVRRKMRGRDGCGRRAQQKPDAPGLLFSGTSSALKGIVRDCLVPGKHCCNGPGA